VSERARETAEIEAQLAPRGLAIRDIAPDGHCLYAAVADQLREAGGGGGVHDVASLRAAVADHMLAVRAEYMPFLETVECDDGKYDAYCRRLRSEAAWGGQVELQALARVLARRVEVFAAGMPVLVMGKGEAGGDGGGPPGTLRVSFHRSYYTLGNHYNSVVGGRNAPPAEAETPGAES
jgi:OTU domain-containing protein 6